MGKIMPKSCYHHYFNHLASSVALKSLEIVVCKLTFQIYQDSPPVSAECGCA